MPAHQSRSFSDVALSAFPRGSEEIAQAADDELSDWVDQAYRAPCTRIELEGSPTFIPYRIHFKGFDDHGAVDTVSAAAACLLTRSTNGYLRQRALRRELGVQEKWVTPFVVLPLGEYVAEISKDIQTRLPSLKRTLYVQFVLENCFVMRLLCARAVSYWDCYYRTEYPERREYPPLAALRELEAWAT